MNDDQKRFDDLNFQFFKGRLPRYQVRRTRKPPPGQHGEVRPEGQIIILSEHGSPEERRRILLHEMCHISTLGHGKRFQAKLRRLAAQGEAWADKEAAECAEACASFRSTTAEIKQAIIDAAMDLRTHSWSRVKRLISDKVGITPKKLSHAAPWAARVWRREARSVRKLLRPRTPAVGVHTHAATITREKRRSV